MHHVIVDESVEMVRRSGAGVNEPKSWPVWQPTGIVVAHQIEGTDLICHTWRYPVLMDTNAMLWNYQPPPVKPREGELLFEFISKAGSPMTCELHFRGESYGYEVQFHRRGELLFSHGAFVSRASAVQWAEQQRAALTTIEEA